MSLFKKITIRFNYENNDKYNLNFELLIIYNVVIQKKLQCVSITKIIKNIIRFKNSITYNQSTNNKSFKVIRMRIRYLLLKFTT